MDNVKRPANEIIEDDQRLDDWFKAYEKESTDKLVRYYKSIDGEHSSSSSGAYPKVRVGSVDEKSGKVSSSVG